MVRRFAFGYIISAKTLKYIISQFVCGYFPFPRRRKKAVPKVGQFYVNKKFFYLDNFLQFRQQICNYLTVDIDPQDVPLMHYQKA